MKKISIGSSVAALFLVAGTAVADDDFLAACEAYADANDAEVNCTCLDEAAQSEASLYEEYAKVSEGDGIENVSEAAQAVIAQCAAE